MGPLSVGKFDKGMKQFCRQVGKEAVQLGQNRLASTETITKLNKIKSTRIPKNEKQLKTDFTRSEFKIKTN
jgi:hypothetical protein